MNARGVRLTMALCLAATTSCRADTFQIDLPRDPDTRSMVVAIEAEDRFDLLGLNVDEIVDLPFFEQVSRRTVITVLLFRRSLADLGVPAGRLMPASSPVRAHHFPASTAVYQRRLESESEVFEPIKLPENLATFEFDAEPTCVEVAVRGLELPYWSGVAALAPHPDGSLVLVNRIGELHQIRGDVIEALPFNVSNLNDEPIGLAIDRQGELWISTSSIGLARGPVTGPLEFVSNPPVMLAEILMSRSESEDVLYARGVDAGLYTYLPRTNSWTRISSMVSAVDPELRRGELRETANGDITAVTETEGRMTTYFPREPQTPAIEYFVSPLLGRPQVMTVHPELGTIFTTTRGRLMTPAEPDPESVAILPYRDDTAFLSPRGLLGVLAFTEVGGVVQVRVDGSVCPMFGELLQSHITANAIEVDGTIIGFGHIRDGELESVKNRIVFVTAK